MPYSLEECRPGMLTLGLGLGLKAKFLGLGPGLELECSGFGINNKANRHII